MLAVFKVTEVLVEGAEEAGEPLVEPTAALFLACTASQCQADEQRQGDEGKSSHPRRQTEIVPTHMLADGGILARSNGLGLASLVAAH